MKKLHKLALSAIVIPAMALGSGSVFAEDADPDSGMDDVMPSQDYMGSAPAGSMLASNLIGANVQTVDDEDVGSVSELIIAQNGQVVGVVVGVGGFLGLGEKNVAIGWDVIMKSGDSDQQQLRIDLTRDDLLSAPEFVNQQ